MNGHERRYRRRQQKKLVVPIFVRPSFERHEVDKRRYDHALTVSQQFDAAKIRLVEVLNDRGYTDADPKPQTTVWERMNLPIALVKIGRRAVHLSELTYDELQDVTHIPIPVPDVVRTDVDLLMTVGRLWGADVIGRVRFAERSNAPEPSRLMSLLHGFRS